MKLYRRNLNRLLLLSGAAAMLPAVVRASPDAPMAGGTLNWAYYPDPNAIIGINTSSGTGQAIGPKINERLLWYDYDLNPRPLLATGWSISPDGLRYTFHLRTGVKWDDRRDFIAEDVAFTIFRLRRPIPAAGSPTKTSSRSKHPITTPPLSCCQSPRLAVGGNNAVDAAALPTGQRNYRLTCVDYPIGDGPGVAAEIGIGAVHLLHGKPKAFGGVFRGLYRRRLKMLQQRWTFVPGRPVGMGDDIVALPRTDWNRDDRSKPQIRCGFAIISDDSAPNVRRETNKVHFVDRQHHVPYAQHTNNVRVAAGLRQHAFAGIDQNDGQIRLRRAGRHVARILLVTRRVSEDERPVRGREIAVRNAA
jgi:hypothetical protein